MISAKANRGFSLSVIRQTLRSAWPMLLLAAVLMLADRSAAQDIHLPERPEPPRLVNDYAGILSGQDADALEARLDQYAKETTTQIAVVIIPTLNGADRAQYATELIHEWGIGQKDKDNGILLLIAKEDRSMFLATGRGVEGALPDAICKRITEYTIKPKFKTGDYAGGINAGIDDIQACLKGEFKNDQPDADQGPHFSVSWIIIAIVIIIILFSFFGGGNNGRTYSSSGSSIPWFLLGALSSGGRSSGGGSWGGGGGGFGGFGGGDSGGGGAGSNW